MELDHIRAQPGFLLLGLRILFVLIKISLSFQMFTHVQPGFLLLGLRNIFDDRLDLSYHVISHASSI